MIGFLAVAGLVVGILIGRAIGRSEQSSELANIALKASASNRTFTLFYNEEAIECKVLKVSLL